MGMTIQNISIGRDRFVSHVAGALDEVGVDHVFAHSRAACGARMERLDPIDGIRDAEPDIVWCGLGAPKQKIWMRRYAAELVPFARLSTPRNSGEPDGEQ